MKTGKANKGWAHLLRGILNGMLQRRFYYIRHLILHFILYTTVSMDEIMLLILIF